MIIHRDAGPSFPGNPKTAPAPRLPARATSPAERWRLDSRLVALLLTIALVAVPGFAAAKFVTLVAALLIGTVSGDFRNHGWLIGGCVAASLSLAYFVAILHEVNAADRDSHFLRIFSFYAVFASLAYVRRGLNTAASIDRVCIAATAIMALLKVGILVAVATAGYSLTDALEFFGFESVTQEFSANIFRLQFPSDFIVLFLLAIYSGRRAVVVDLLFVSAVVVVIFLSFSRFIFLCFFVGLFVRTVWMRRVDLITGLSGLLLVVALVSFSDALLDRFVGEGSKGSDEIRVEQIEELEKAISNNPVLGTGVGASIPTFLRSETLPYSYEVQWYAAVMQLGLVGTALLVWNVGAITLFGLRSRRARMCLTVLLGMWIFAGFTNPFITSLGSAVGLSLARRRAQISG